MSTWFLISIVLLGVLPAAINNQCIETPNVPETYLCANPNTNILTPSVSKGWSKLVSDTSGDMYISFRAKLLNNCTTGAGPYTFLSVSLMINGTESKYLRFYGEGTGYYCAYYREDGITIQRSTIVSYTTNFTANFGEFLCGIQRDDPRNFYYASASVDGRTEGNITSTGTGARTFNSSTKIYFCSEFGQNPISCRIKDLKIFYNIGDVNIKSKFGGLSPVALRSYDFSERKGSQIKNMLADSDHGYLGDLPANPTESTVPQRSPSGIGIEFTSSNQSITLPALTLASSSPENSLGSISIFAWIYFTTAPAAESYIFSVRSEDGQTMRMGLGIGATRVPFCKIGTSSRTPASPVTAISLNTWKQVGIKLDVRTTAGRYFLDFYSDVSTYAMGATTSTPNPFSFQTTDKVTIGHPSAAFIGKIAFLRIFSPAAAIFNSGGDCSNALMPYTLGLTTASIPYKCGLYFYKDNCIDFCPLGTYTDTTITERQTCLECTLIDPWCSECSDQSTCTYCRGGKVPSGNACACPANTNWIDERCVEVKDFWSTPVIVGFAAAGICGLATIVTIAAKFAIPRFRKSSTKVVKIKPEARLDVKLDKKLNPS